MGYIKDLTVPLARTPRAWLYSLYQLNKKHPLLFSKALLEHLAQDPVKGSQARAPMNTLQIMASRI